MNIKIGKSYARKNDTPVKVIGFHGGYYICYEYITHELKIDETEEIKVHGDEFDHEV